MIEELIRHNQNFRIFGRKKGRKAIKSSNSSLLNNFLLDLSSGFTVKKIVLDIGSGNGENTIFLSKKYPNYLIIASDVYHDGNVNLSKKLYNEKIDNVKIFNKNVLLLLDNLNLQNLIKEIWILFPDPWPKIKHNKRRLINFSFIKKINSMLTRNSKVYIVTDDVSYFISILRNFFDSKSFKWINDLPTEWNYNLNIFYKTKYFEKSLSNNKKSFILIFQKI